MRTKCTVSVTWIHGIPFVERNYYTWESKRTPRIIFDPQDETYTKKEPPFKGRNKKRWEYIRQDLTKKRSRKTR